MQTTLRQSSENAGFYPSRVLLIGGSARAAADSAVAAGFRVAALDAFGDRDLRHSVEHWRRCEAGPPLLEGLGELLASDPAAATAIVLVGGGEAILDSLQVARNRFESPTVRFLAPTADEFRAAAEPQRLQHIAQRSGIAFPPWHPLPLTADAASLEPRGAWLIKPTLRFGGLSVARYHGGPIAVADGYLQQAITGRLWGVSYCAGEQGVRCLGACRSRTAAGDEAPFRYAGSTGPVTVSQARQRLLDRLGEAVQETLSVRGLFGVDLIETPSQLYLLEVNLRYCASMELLETDAMHCMALHVESFAQADRSSAASSRSTAAVNPATLRCKRIVYADHKICWDEHLQRRLEQFQRDSQGSCSLHDLPCTGTIIAADTPLLTVIAPGRSAADAWQQACRRSVQLMRALSA